MTWRRTALAVASLAILLALAWLLAGGLGTGAPSGDRSEPSATAAASQEQPPAGASAAASGAVLTVRVVGAGAPLAKAKVVLSEAAHAHRLPATASTDPRGVARLGHVRPGSYRLRVTHPDFAIHLRTVEVIQARAQRIEVALERGVNIAGTVVDRKGSPVAGATVRALAAESTEEFLVRRSSADGRFEMKGLPVRAFRLYTHTGWHLPAYTDPITFSEPGQRHRVTIKLEPGLTIQGRVVTSDGTPVAGARVGSSDEGSSFVTTDADGRFELGGLRAGPVNVFATAAGFATTHRRGVAAGSRSVELALDEEASLSGTVVSARPISKLEVSLCHHDPYFDKELCVARRVYGPASVGFSLDGLAAGQYELVIVADGHAVERVPVQITAGRELSVPPVKLRATE